MSVLDSLKKVVREKKALFVVGAGVSMSATNAAKFASWSGLLESGVDRCLDLGLVSEGWAEENKKQFEE